MYKSNINNENDLSENNSLDESLEIGEIEDITSKENIEGTPTNDPSINVEQEKQQEQSETSNKTIEEKIANLEQALKNDYDKALKGDNNYTESNTILENDFKNLTDAEKQQLAIKSVVGTLQMEKDEKGYPVYSNYVTFSFDKDTNDIKISPVSSSAVFAILNESLKARNAIAPKNFNSTEEFIEKNKLSLDDFTDVELKLLEDIYAIKNAQTHDLTETKVKEKVEEKVDAKTELATTNNEPNTETVQEDGTIFGTNSNALDLSNAKQAENAIVSDPTPKKEETPSLEKVVNDTLDAVAGETKKPEAEETKTDETKTDETKTDKNKKDDGKKDDGKGKGGGGGNPTIVKAALTGSLALLALILAITGFGGVLLLLLVIAAAIGSTQLELGGGGGSVPVDNVKDDKTKADKSKEDSKDKTATTEKTDDKTDKKTDEKTEDKADEKAGDNKDLPDIDTNKTEETQEKTENTETPALEGNETKLLESNEGVEQSIPEDNKTTETAETPALEGNETPLLESETTETTNKNIPQIPVAPVEKEDEGMER